MFSGKDRPVTKMPGWNQCGECKTRVVFIVEYDKEDFDKADAEKGVIQAIQKWGTLIDRQVFYPGD